MMLFVRKNLLLLFSLTAIIVAALYALLAPYPLTPELNLVSSMRSVVTGVVIRDPDIRENSQFLTVRIETLNGKAIQGRILATVDRYSSYSYGDRVSINGIVGIPENFETSTGRIFNYRKFLLASGVTHVIQFGLATTLEREQGNVLVSKLLFVKHFLLYGLEQALPEPESSLAGGLLLGEKQSLGQNITDSFRRSGVIHIIVLSGYNVSLVISTLMFVLGYFLPRVWTLTIAGIGILLFAVMTGASETTVRASIMALIVLLAQGLRRPTEGLRVLAIAAAGMAIVNPYVVLYDLSYQLSILATLGLILFSNPLAKRLTFIPESLGLRDICATTLATQCTVLPILIVAVGQISLVALLANVAILPAVPLAMLFSFVAALIAPVSYLLALPVSMLAHSFLAYIISGAVFFGSLPYASFVIPVSYAGISVGALLVLYVALFATYMYRKDVWYFFRIQENTK